MKLLLILAFGFAAFNTGLIWIVQIVHYPGFLRIGESAYETYQAFHMRAITWVVAPSMLLELVASALLLFYLKELPSPGLLILSFLFLILIWFNTALFAAPTHAKLLHGFNAELIEKLISINWWRTLFWSLRSVLLSYLLWRI